MADKILNEDIDYKILADHFGKTKEAFRLLRRKWESERSGLWPIYVKAYNFDQIQEGKNGIK